MEEKVKKPEDFLEEPKTDAEASEVTDVEILEEIEEEDREENKK